MAELGKAYVQIIPSAKGISGSISTALNPEAKAAGKGAGVAIAGNISASMGSAGKKMTAGFTVPFAAGIGAAIKTTADFDSAMSQVAAVSGATGGDFDKLRDKAREMGSKTKFSASEAAEAMNYMAMAGWKTGDMLGGVEGIMNLAAASGEDLATTSDIVTDALTAFGMSANDSGHFADVLAAASSNANTNVSMLGESFKYAAPVAGSLGVSAEDTSLALGLMANAGIKASMSGTALRTGLTNLAKPTKQMQTYMDKYHISLVKNADGSVNLRGTMQQLREKLGGLSESEQAAAATAIFGKNSMSGWLAIVNSSDKDFNKLSGAIDNCDGTAGKMADTMQNNMAGQTQILKSQLQELAISLGDALMPMLQGMVKHFQGFVDHLNKMDPGLRNFIVKTLMVVAAIGPALVVTSKVITAVGTIGKAMRTIAPLLGMAPKLIRGIGTAFSAVGKIFLANPILLIIIGIVAGIILLVTHWEQVKKVALKVWAAIKPVLETAKNVIKKTVEVIIAVTTAPFRAAAVVLKAIWTGLKAAFTAAWNGIKTAAKTIGGGIKTAVTTVFSGVKKHIIGPVKDAIGNTKKNFRTLKNVYKANGGGVKGIWAAAHSAMRGTTLKVFKAINKATGGKLGEMLAKVRDKIRKIKEFFKFSGLRDTVSKIFGKIRDAITAPIRKARDVIKGIIDKIKGFFHFDFHLPHLKLPHFSISPKGWKIGDLLKGSIPSLGIEWYAKGGIVNGATLIGAGEAGAEAILPLDRNTGWMDMLADRIGANGQTVNITVNVSGADDPEEWGRRLAAEVKRRARMGVA